MISSFFSLFAPNFEDPAPAEPVSILDVLGIDRPAPVDRDAPAGEPDADIDLTETEPTVSITDPLEIFDV